MKPTAKPVRIGNAQAFWGDRADAAAEMLAREPEIDYITLDYLAEVSMSILAMQRERDPGAGFARDFIEVIRSLAPYWSFGGRCRLITNAGGLNPLGCAEACRAALEQAGCRSLRIGIVAGDDVLEQARAVAATQSHNFKTLDTGASIGHIRDRLVTANAYLGAGPIIEALADGADIVITGRVADPSLVVAPCVYHFGWNEDQLDRLAGATVAGHLVECGTQVTGGISTDWLDVPDPAHIGFPIVEVAEDGSCVVTKPRGTGGCVTPATVKEQLVYEIGDPANYLSPDVAVSFLSLAVEDLGNDRVRVTGAKGKSRPDQYKVSATYRDGFRAAGTLTVIGRDATAKARRCGELVLARVNESGFELRDSMIECVGSGDAAARIAGDDRCQSGRFAEILLRIAVEADSREALECFARGLMPLITAGPQGTTGYAEGRPQIHFVFRYWPCLIARNAVTPRVEFVQSANTKHVGLQPGRRGDQARAPIEASTAVAGSAGSDPIGPPTTGLPSERKMHLYDIAHARSGDKGTSANVGVIARSEPAWEFMQTWLSADRVAAFFSPLGLKRVERFELPSLQALNFVLHGALKRSLRTDAQGKALGQILLEMPLPEGFSRRIGPNGE
jgi:Acyclic terpene utilisation family protein AtuA